MIGYMSANVATKFFVIILQFLSSCVFILIQGFCSTFMNIATLQIGTGFVEEFVSRIYVVIGILMLFKLSFSLLTSVINPDALTDKEKGLGNIVKRTFISLILLIFVPIIFTKALGWQTSLAKLVPRLVVGSEFTNSESANNVGAQLASDALKPFVIPNPECEGADDRLGEAKDLNEVLALTILTCEEAGGTGKNIFAYEFNGIIATVVGIIMVVILAGYCIDMAIRVIKLGILRILAPIPIISYIDPKSEKAGAFNNWLKECISTYIELFIKLAIFYFVLEILGNLSSENVEFFANSENLNGFVWLFIMIGAFFFMGKASDFIYNILGLKKPSGAGGLLKGLAGIGAAVGIGAATLSSARTNYRGSLASQKANGIINPSKGKAIASAILGGGVGAVTASKAVAGAKSGKMGAALAAAYKRNTAYAATAASGATLGGKASSYFQRAFTGETDADTIQRKYDVAKSGYENSGKLFDYVTGEGVKKSSNVALTANGTPKTFGNTVFNKAFSYDDFVTARQIAEKNGHATFSVGGATIDTYGSSVNYIDSEIKKTLGDIYYANNKSDVKLQRLAKAADIELPANADGFTTKIKTKKDVTEKDMLLYANQLTKAKANADATKPK